MPQETDIFLQEIEKRESFPINEFFDRISIREGVDKTAAVFYARVVMSVVNDAVSQGEMDHVQEQLPDEYTPLFKFDDVTQTH